MFGMVIGHLLWSLVRHHPKEPEPLLVILVSGFYQLNHTLKELIFTIEVPQD
jgi:hypothetical protein